MYSLEELQSCLDKANQAAKNRDWKPLASQTLALLQEICQAEAAIIYPSNFAASPDDALAAEFESAPWLGCPEGISPVWWKALRKKLLQPELFRPKSVRWIDRDTVLSEQSLIQAFSYLPSLRNLMILPLPHSKGLPSGAMLFNSSTPRLELAQVIAQRLASELEKAAELDSAIYREERLMALNEILGQLGASLNPDEVLRMFIERARQFLNVEAVSLFLLDEEKNELVLQMASHADQQVQVEKLRVPRGEGIIGKVVQTGETLLVENAKQDHRHYEKVDAMSGFYTRSILAVPLRSRPIDLGEGRGTSKERIIGGLEAINKIDGGFRAEDIEMLQILAKGAATILVIANLFVDANGLFFDVVHGLVTAIEDNDLDSPFRKDVPVDELIRFLRKKTDQLADGDRVEAALRAYQVGRAKTQFLPAQDAAPQAPGRPDAPESGQATKIL